MRTIQMTLDDELVSTVDRVAKKLGTTRSAFTRKALRNAINQVNTAELEKKHRSGYKHFPIAKSEFNVWEAEQNWGDE